MQYQKQQVDPVCNVCDRTSKKCSENRCWLHTIHACMHGNSIMLESVKTNIKR